MNVSAEQLLELQPATQPHVDPEWWHGQRLAFDGRRIIFKLGDELSVPDAIAWVLSTDDVLYVGTEPGEVWAVVQAGGTRKLWHWSATERLFDESAKQGPVAKRQPESVVALSPVTPREPYMPAIRVCDGRHDIGGAVEAEGQTYQCAACGLFFTGGHQAVCHVARSAS